MKNIEKNWFVYIIESTDDKLYTGITTDVSRRWKEHRDQNKGAKFFRGRKPKALLFVSAQPDRSIATKMEIRIKKLKLKDKIRLVNSKDNQMDNYEFQI